jgi:GT2 family glycosyltransferase
MEAHDARMATRRAWEGRRHGSTGVLTVFIATHNGAETLPRILTAYTELLPPPGGWKIVIIDNGSDDESARIARSFADRLPLVVIDEPRRGKNRALNAGLHQLEGDLAVFSDDDSLPEPDWLQRLRAAADHHPEYAVFGGRILALWEAEPEDWVLKWVRTAPVFGMTDADRDEGPCDPTRVWGPNMAIRAECLRQGYRFDERLGPNGSPTYSMGGETELILRLAIAEQVACWHCRDARVHHIVTAQKMTRAWILKRAFHLGRCVRRESKQLAGAGRPHLPRGASAICAGLAREAVNLASAYRIADARRVFEARWQLNLWCGCLYEALSTRYEPQRPLLHVGPPA